MNVTVMVQLACYCLSKGGLHQMSFKGSLCWISSNKMNQRDLLRVYLFANCTLT